MPLEPPKTPNKSLLLSILGKLAWKSLKVRVLLKTKRSQSSPTLGTWSLKQYFKEGDEFGNHFVVIGTTISVRAPPFHGSPIKRRTIC